MGITPFFSGMALFVATVSQQIGLQYTPAGKSAFLTTLYIVIVPILGIFLGKKIKALQTVGIALALVGVACLSLNEKLKFSLTDGYMIFAAFFFALDIIFVDKYIIDADPIKFCVYRFMPSAVLSGIISLIWETTTMDMIGESILPLLYLGLLSSGIAYTLQAVGQKMTDSVTAVILMTFEGAFAVLSGWLILGEQLSFREGIGCIIMFVAAIIVQVV